MLQHRGGQKLLSKSLRKPFDSSLGFRVTLTNSLGGGREKFFCSLRIHFLGFQDSIHLLEGLIGKPQRPLGCLKLIWILILYILQNTTCALVVIPSSILKLRVTGVMSIRLGRAAVTMKESEWLRL